MNEVELSIKVLSNLLERKFINGGIGNGFLLGEVSRGNGSLRYHITSCMRWNERGLNSRVIGFWEYHQPYEKILVNVLARLRDFDFIFVFIPLKKILLTHLFIMQVVSLKAFMLKIFPNTFSSIRFHPPKEIISPLNVQDVYYVSLIVSSNFILLYFPPGIWELFAKLWIAVRILNLSNLHPAFHYLKRKFSAVKFSMTIDCREARIDDINALLDFYHSERILGDEEIIRKEIASLKSIFIVGRLQSRIVGIAKATMDAKNRWWIYDVYVAKSMRGRGVGKKLMETLEEKLRHRCVEKVFISVSRFNKPAVSLYQKFGYIRDEECIILENVLNNDSIPLPKAFQVDRRLVFCKHL